MQSMFDEIYEYLVNPVKKTKKKHSKKRRTIMLNMKNFGYAEGRVSQDIKIFDNKDGSKKVKLKLGIQNNYKGADGSYGTNFIAFDGFIAKPKDGKNDSIGVYASIHNGDKIGIMYEMRANAPYEKNGVTVYEQVAMIQQIDLKESKATTDARAAKKAQTPPVEQDPATAEPVPATDVEDEEKPFAESN